MSDPFKTKLRVGVFVGSSGSTAWIASVLEELRKSSLAEVTVVVLPAADPSDTAHSSSNDRFGLFQRYEQWDRERNPSLPEAEAPADLSPLLSGIPEMHVSPEQATEAVASLQPYGLDVLLNLSERPVPNALAETARYGVWSFCFSQYAAGAGHPFWPELYRQSPVSESQLVAQLHGASLAKVLYRSFASTNPRSLHATRNPVYWKTATFVLRALRDLSEFGASWIDSRPSKAPPVASLEPTNARMLQFGARYLSRSLATKSARLFSRVPKWQLAIRRREPGLPYSDASGYRLLPCPKDHFHADPFLFESEGKTFLFFEDLPFADNRGLISVCELAADGTPGPVQEVLRRPYHLSYPFVFEEDGIIYMIPETKENGTVELYRARRFPDQWELDTVLLKDIRAVDATIHQRDGKYWMFVGTSTGSYSNCDELSIYFADALRGPWMPHPRNPVLSDVRYARPAGMLFEDGTRLIRPSQDCGPAYGYGLIFSEVLELNEREYREQAIARIEPDSAKGHFGNHTYNRSAQFEVIDLNARS